MSPRIITASGGFFSNSLSIAGKRLPKDDPRDVLSLPKSKFGFLIFNSLKKFLKDSYHNSD